MIEFRQGSSSYRFLYKKQGNTLKGIRIGFNTELGHLEVGWDRPPNSGDDWRVDHLGGKFERRYVPLPPDAFLHLYCGWMMFAVPTPVFADALQDLAPDLEEVCILMREYDEEAQQQKVPELVPEG